MLDTNDIILKSFWNLVIGDDFGSLDEVEGDIHINPP